MSSMAYRIKKKRKWVLSVFPVLFSEYDCDECVCVFILGNNGHINIRIWDTQGIEWRVTLPLPASFSP